jgi:Fe-S cluster biogenesis protein NfuA
MEVREFIKNWIADGKDVLIQMPAPKPVETVDEAKEQKIYEPSEYDEAIISLLDEYVRPAVENDGGAIDFRSFKDGVVTVAMRGSCSGCPSSTATLKGGIENLLKSHLPEVKEVVAENA